MVGRKALRTWLVAVAIGLAALFAGRRSDAQPALDLTWSAPPSCPDRAWMQGAVLRLVTSSPPQALRVVGAVREEEGRWVVDLELSGAAVGTRTLRASTCKAVSRGAALIVALALDPQAAAFASEELARDEPPSSSPPSPPPPKPEPPQPQQRQAAERAAAIVDRASSLRPIVFAGASAERALVPGIAPGVAVGGGVVWRALRGDLAASFAPSASTSLARLPAVGADFSLASIALRGCIGQAIGPIGVHGCAAFRGARIEGKGTGIARSYHESAYVNALEPGILLRFPSTTQVALELDGAAVLPITRPDFVILSSGPAQLLFRASPIGVRVAVAASFRL